jgi:hypothetical protein
MSFTPTEIQFLGDLNFKARAELNHTGSLASRLLLLAPKLKDGTWQTWILDNEVLNAMAANEYGQNDPRSQPILDRFATAFRTTIDWNYRLPAPQPEPVTSVPTTDTAKLIAQLEARVKALETSGAQVPAGTQVFDGDVIFRGRVGFGGLNPKVRSKVQIVGEASSLHFQNAAGDVGMISLSGDRGLRLQQNGYDAVDQFDAYDPDGKVSYKSNNVQHADPTRAWVNFGPDSKGDLSLTKRMPKGAKGDDHEYTQDWVFRIDEDRKEAGFRLYRPGFKWLFAVDSKYGPETFWTPELYVSRG